MAMDTPARSFEPFASDAPILAIVEAFRARTLPFAEWSHQAHLATGLWHVATHGEAAARDRLREGIKAYNLAVGRGNDDMRGYHETVTMYFVWSAARFLEGDAPPDLAGRVNAYVAGPFGAKDGIFIFWTRERLLSPQARLAWVEPDIRPLDPAALLA
ncbi:hypothetical protein [Phreatobacter cathodiphilus]|uniref:Uncharacterized protein n=1 Tax=Phreatobacter cathodiphilus TaxID=1868589 RepID=A0A2S0N635_9HYPH|nr:hypothetical protein [Phreatobacter cathodiphilus]AVO43598.1 hypothetical protein C6569_00015 [Phreatobacter cathodiphilus]